MVKKYTVDKKIIQELTRAVKELTKALEKSNLNKNTYIKQVIDEQKRVKVHHSDALVSPMVGTVYLSPEPGKKTFVIEKDFNLANLLNEKFRDKINIINKDILKFKLNSITKEKLTIYGNLPYNISTKILTQLITVEDKFTCYKKLILMFQKEVADRILAKTNSKSYGRLSIISNWRLNIKKEFNIKSKCFFPQPKVDSTLLSFVPKKNFFYLKNPKNLEKITRIFFNQRRKMIKKPLKQIFRNPEKVAENFKLDVNLRPQNLNLLTYLNITREYERLNN